MVVPPRTEAASWLLARFCVPFKVSIWLRSDESAIAPATQRLQRRLTCGEGRNKARTIVAQGTSFQ
jgi:hypothetical protein